MLVSGRVSMQDFRGIYAMYIGMAVAPGCQKESQRSGSPSQKKHVYNPGGDCYWEEGSIPTFYIPKI